ncbi:hypothetical protein [Robiginitalea marina]|uniref:Uncharacterized protein n=1 Tax=Robiginitalea marina TaxID=2954105 RepID=A0ABT1AUJ0_9FLAO|nr:hypothetical protein [Robiginitalea marina]MCO5723706.1 hypothetical protein [Robiginitalea marina]
MRDSLMFPRLLAPGIRTPLHLHGLDEFTRSLERLFYARARVECTAISKSSASFTISLECPLSIREVLDAYGNGCWGHQRIEGGNGAECRNLGSLHRELEQRSGLKLVMEELSLQCADTLLVLQKIRAEGVQKDFYPLLHLLGLQDARVWDRAEGRPVEIYAPVRLANRKNTPGLSDDPIRYWAIYCEKKEEPLIFDSCLMREVEGDLSLNLG